MMKTDLIIRPENECKYDAVSLSEVMLRKEVEALMGGAGARVQR